MEILDEEKIQVGVYSHKTEICYVTDNNLPCPPLQITALESPTFATSKRSPTIIAVEAVEPASRV
jgi:hypothetical protein